MAASSPAQPVIVQSDVLKGFFGEDILLNDLTYRGMKPCSPQDFITALRLIVFPFPD